MSCKMTGTMYGEYEQKSGTTEILLENSSQDSLLSLHRKELTVLHSCRGIVKAGQKNEKY